MADNIITPYGVLSFPVLFTPRSAVEGQDPRYSVNLIFDEEAQASKAYKAMVAAIEAEADAFFKGKRPKNWRNPIRDAGERDYTGYNEGDTFISAWSKLRPGLTGPNCEDILSHEEVWAGQLACAQVRPFGYNQAGNSGVALGLNAVQIADFARERLDGRKPANQVFQPSPFAKKSVADDECPI